MLSVQIVSTDDYMPMAINSLQEYDKVINVSWFVQEQPVDELTWVYKQNAFLRLRLTYLQLSLRSTILANVPSMLHRHQELSESVLLLFG